MKNVLKPLAKSVLKPLELTAAALATDAAIQKKIFGSGMNAIIISNEEMNGFMKIWFIWLAKPLKMKQQNKKADFSVCY